MSDILEILEIEIEEDCVNVRAVVDEMITIRGQTYFEEEQFAPGVCEASYELEEGEVFPETEKEQIKFLEELDLDWDLIELD